MPYIQRETKYDNGDIKVDKYFSLRYGKKGNRGFNRTETSDRQKTLNRLAAEKKRADLIYNNFREGRDYWVTLTYPKELKPAGFEEAHKTFTKFMAKIKRKYKSVMYMGCTDDNRSGNNPHHHLVFSWGGATRKDAPLTGFDLRDMWRKYIGTDSSGGKVEQIYNLTNGDLAAYFNALKPKTFDADGNPENYVEKKFTRSRNLKEPKVTRKVVNHSSWRHDPPARKGYEIDQVKYGQDIIGFETQSYILRKRC